MPYKKLALTESNTLDTEASVKYVNHTTESSSLHNSHKSTIVKSKLPGFIYMLIEDFAGLKSENDKLRKFHEEEGRKI